MDLAGRAPDYGNSHLRMMDCVANNLSKISGLGILQMGINQFLSIIKLKLSIPVFK
jgi:hypothetical protein